MSVINSDSMRAGASGVSAAGYVIENSCRFNPGDSAFMSRTPSGSGTGGGKVQTISVWLKRCNFGVTHRFLSGTATKETTIQFNDTNTLHAHTTSGADLDSRSVYRDPSAWYHVVVAYDTDNGTAGDRVRSYVNGVELTSYGTETTPSSGFVTGLFVTTTMYIGKLGWGSNYWDGYMAEFIGIDGQQLTPSSFGEFDSKGNWVPIDPTELTFGTHGFWLDFAVAPGTGNGAGTDVSGNGNHFTDSGLAANDQVKDSPTDDADNDVGNKMVFLPFFPSDNAAGTIHFTEGNTQFLDDYSPNSENGICRGSMWFETGKWYWEIEITGTPATVDTMVGVGSPPITSNGMGGNIVAYRADGAKVIDATWTGGYGNTYTNGDKIGVALDMDSYDVEFFDNGVSQGVLSLTGTIADGGWSVWSQRNGASTLFQFRLLTDPADWAGSAPTGFVAPCTANFPAPAIPDPSKYFQVDTFTGTGSELVRTLTDAAGGAVKPDLVWIKDRDSAVEHVLTDSARGATKELNPDANSAESTVAQGLKSFDTSGYTLGTDGNYNASSSLNVAWCWNTQGGAGASNTDGSINTTTTSVGSTQGMSISTFVGTGSAATIGHGLGAVPELIIVRKLLGDSWIVKHVGHTANNDYQYLNTAIEKKNYDFWNNTAPTSSVFSIGSDGSINASGATLLVFCWAGVEGYSKFGTYEGNANADGPFIWCGFRPAWVMCKSMDSTSPWDIFDHKRLGYNVDNEALAADTIAAETTTDEIDLLSNGFKLRTTGDPNIAETYIFAAFAEFPSGGEDVSQARAR